MEMTEEQQRLMAGFVSSMGQKKEDTKKPGIIKGEGQEHTFEISGVAGIHRVKSPDSAMVPGRGAADLSLGNRRPIRPDRITQGDEEVDEK